jgi:hypothetical protein
MVYKSVFLRGFPEFFWNIARYFVRNGTARLRCKDTTFDFGEMCIRRYSMLFDAFRCFSMQFIPFQVSQVRSFLFNTEDTEVTEMICNRHLPILSQSENSVSSVLKNIRLLLLLCRFVDLRHERVFHRCRRFSRSDKGKERARPAISLVFFSFSLFSFSLRRGVGGRISFSVFRFLSFSLKFDEKKTSN